MMNKENKKRPCGRPRKEQGRTKFGPFTRSGMVMSAYDEARERGEKHSAAVTDAVEVIRRQHPRMPVSDTEVKRTLATYRPRNSRSILRFKRLIVGDEKLAKLRSMLEQARTPTENWSLVPPPSTQSLEKSRTVYTFGYGERPLFPRHNRKIPKE